MVILICLYSFNVCFKLVQYTKILYMLLFLVKVLVCSFLVNCQLYLQILNMKVAFIEMSYQGNKWIERNTRNCHVFSIENMGSLHSKKEAMTWVLPGTCVP